ncbi:MAG: leucine-rich repeat domain-containing protein, partial [Acutalibacteraceae bacterium]
MKKLKQITALLLVVLMVTTTSPLTGMAGIFSFTSAAEDSSATPEENISYTFNEDTGLLTINGSGPMQDYELDEESLSVNTPYYQYRDKITSLVVEEGITEIGTYAFALLINLKTAVLPSTLTSISAGAFYGNLRLESVNLPSSLLSIGSYAFCMCLSLKTVDLPENVQLCANVYEGCMNLSEITIPENITLLDESDSSGLIPLHPYNLEVLHNYSKTQVVYCLNLFASSEDAERYICLNIIMMEAQILFREEGEEAVYSYIVNSTNEKFGTDFTDFDEVSTYTDQLLTEENNTDRMTVYCSKDSKQYEYCSENSITCYPNEENISYTFNEDTGLLTISGSGPMQDYDFDDEGFSVNTPYCQYRDKITSLVVEEGITEIGTYAFAFLPNLKTAVLPSTLTSIGDAAFYYDLRLESVNLPSSLLSIGQSSFAMCFSLNAVDFPEGVQVNEGAYATCLSLNNITIPENITFITDSETAEPIYFDTYNLEVLTNYSKTQVIVCTNYFSSSEDADRFTYINVISCEAGLLFSEEEDEAVIYSYILDKVNEELETNFTDIDEAYLYIEQWFTEENNTDRITVYCDEDSKQYEFCVENAITCYPPQETGSVEGIAVDDNENEFPWNLDKSTGVLEIAGSGDMLFSESVPDWCAYGKKIQEIRFSSDSEITSIDGASTFENVNAQTVTVPDSLSTWHGAPFIALKKLQNIYIENNAAIKINNSFDVASVNGVLYAEISDETISDYENNSGTKLDGNLVMVFYPCGRTYCSIESNAIDLSFTDCSFSDAVVPDSVLSAWFL